MLQILRSRWLALGVHAGLWLMLYLAVVSLGGNVPEFRETDAFSKPSQSPAPVARLVTLFSPGIWPKPIADTNALNPFVTTYFIPSPTPAAPPPTIRKIELTYLGFYQTADGPKHAVVKLGDSFIVSPLGAKVASNLFAAQATLQMLTLTNPAAQTNLLPVNTKKEIEVPIR